MIISSLEDEAKTINLESYFKEDFLSTESAFREKLEYEDIIILGAAGSIGFAMLPFVLSQAPRKLLLIDQDENRLTLLLRLIRAKDWVSPSTKLSIAAMDYGSTEARRLLNDYSANPKILNFAAAKHVRSERDIYGIAHLLNENFVKPWRLIEDLNPSYYFGVSTDKAANPVNFMGASKALHEQLLFSISSSSARFANVAFSQGSLLDSWRYRLTWKEPLVVPRDIERFLITPEDAARLCAISIAKANNSSIVVPNEGVVKSFFLHKIASEYLLAKNLNAVVFDDYAKARDFLNSKRNNTNEWALVLTESDTSGEKKFEEFVGVGEFAAPLTTLTSEITPNKTNLKDLIKIRDFVMKEHFHSKNTWREELIGLIAKAIPTFEPVLGEEFLDMRP
jgi:FlaA1/EpsC-like NDP-sugar epimerase